MTLFEYWFHGKVGATFTKAFKDHREATGLAKKKQPPVSSERDSKVGWKSTYSTSARACMLYMDALQFYVFGLGTINRPLFSRNCDAFFAENKQAG